MCSTTIKDDRLTKLVSVAGNSVENTNSTKPVDRVLNFKHDSARADYGSLDGLSLSGEIILRPVYNLNWINGEYCNRLLLLQFR